MTSPETLRIRPDGFLERGAQVTRLEAFVDAAFAFAVTLLVIQVGAVPESVEAMTEALKGVPAFAASFALIAMFWHAHHMHSRRYGLDDGLTLFLSLLLVFLVLVYVYPLRMLFGQAFAWASQVLPEGWRIELTRDLRLPDLQRMFVIYAVAWISLGAVVVALYHHAWRRRDALALSLQERIDTCAEIARWSMIPATGVLSLLAALLLPYEHDRRNVATAGIPGMIYSLMAFSGVAMALAARRARRRLAPESPAAS